MIPEDLLSNLKLNNLVSNSLGEAFDQVLEEKLCQFYLENGRYDLPNTVEKVELEDPDWKTIKGDDALFRQDYFLQQSVKDPRLARLVKEKYDYHIRVAQGHIEAMEEKLKRFLQPCFYNPGDLIYIDRDKTVMDASTLESMIELLKDKNFLQDKLTLPMSIYAHVGIYIGKNEVVHFSGKNDLVGTRTVHICSLKDFLKSSETNKTPKDIYVMYFPGDGRRPYKLYQDTSKLSFNPAHIDAFEVFNFEELKCFSPAETVERAKKMARKTGYEDYDFLDNNCEHMAFFCKTGRKFSVQAENLKKLIDDSQKLLNTPVEGYNSLLDKLKQVSSLLDEVGKSLK